MPLPGTTESREGFPSCVNFFLAMPLQYPPKGGWRSHLTIKRCPRIMYNNL
ncbi:hypothetical protein RintRC_0905 [Richelia intracellularis]|nr:hypothetical protein RintRC_0905 [Richelia intracellularis]